MIRRPPRSTQSRSSAASDVYKRQLLIMMAIKFVMVVSYFMHLKFDNKVFSWLFYTGLVLAVGVYCAALATFKFFG